MSLDLPREVIEACCADDEPPVRAWMESRECRLDAATRDADLRPGTRVEARFHGGEEYYAAVVKAVQHEGDASTAAGSAAASRTHYDLEYIEDKKQAGGEHVVWGAFEKCPREHIRVAGSTVRNVLLAYLAYNGMGD